MFVDGVLVKSKGMFKEYWNKPEATATSFDEEVSTGTVVIPLSRQCGQIIVSVQFNLILAVACVRKRKYLVRTALEELTRTCSDTQVLCSIELVLQAFKSSVS